MHEHNLEYPHFYRQLYALTTADALAGPHRATFASELQLFLSSVRPPPASPTLRARTHHAARQ